MDWNHISPDALDTISPHDCVADKLILNEESITFNFSDGFWVSHLHPLNSHDKTIRTTKAHLCLLGNSINEYVPLIYIYKSVWLFGKLLLTKRIFVEWDKFIENINNGKWQLEFIDIYRDYSSVLIKGVLHAHKKMIECELTLLCNRVEFRWNDFQENRFW